MSLPASDVSFLLRVMRVMCARRLSAYTPGAPRTAVAIVLRFDNPSHQHAVRQNPQSLASLACVDIPSSLRVLCLHPSTSHARGAGRWGSAVVFPGGAREEEDADDFATVCRTVYAMIGLPLQSPEMMSLGRLRDVSLPTKPMSWRVGFVRQARFVFLHTGDLSPSVRLARDAVGAAQWVPLRAFTKRNDSVRRPLCAFLPTPLAALFPRGVLRFPAVMAEGQWAVWGATLRTIEELLAMHGKAPMDWPLMEADNPLVQHFFIDAWHGYYEVCYAYWRTLYRWRKTHPKTACKAFFTSTCSSSSGVVVEEPTRHEILPHSASAMLWAVPEHMNPTHVFFFALDLVLLLGMMYGVASIISVVCALLQSALAGNDAVETRTRIRAYYTANPTPGAERCSQPRQEQPNTANTDAISSHRSSTREGGEKRKGTESSENYKGEENGARLDDSIRVVPYYTVPMESNDNQGAETTTASTPTHFKETAIGKEKDGILPDVNDWDAFRRQVREWAGQHNTEDASTHMTATHKVEVEESEECEEMSQTLSATGKVNQVHTADGGVTTPSDGEHNE